MTIEIVNKNLVLNIHGYSGTAINKDYSGTAFKLMDKMWQTVKQHHLKNKGNNIWVYEQYEKLFAGVELTEGPGIDTTLEYKRVELLRYAFYKHTGPYNLIKEVGANMRAELNKMGLRTSFPYIEIYGHWTADESKLETSLFISLE